MGPLLFSVLMLLCESSSGKKIIAEVDIHGELTLMDSERIIPVQSQTLIAGKDGELESIEASYLWEYFKVQKTEGQWTGEYWYDNAGYKLACHEIPVN